MPARSKKQQRFFGIIYSCKKKGNKSKICKSKKIRNVSKSISKKDAKDFASTKHQDLPEVSEQDYYVFKSWSQFKEEKMQEKCKCECNACVGGDCSKCTCENCKCENCTCC